MIYLAILIKVALLRYYSLGDALKQVQSFHYAYIEKGWKEASFMPFRTISEYIFYSNVPVKIKVENLLADLIAFAPLGALLPLVAKKFLQFKFVIVAALIISIGFESFQWIYKLGVFDVDHILLNLFGTIAGFYPIKLIHNMNLTKQRVLSKAKL